MVKKIIYLNLTILFFCALLYAQEEKCMKEFNINRVKLQNYQPQSDLSLLSNYFLCRATLIDNIRECDKLNPDDAQKCRAEFNKLHGIFVKLLIDQQVTPEVLSACLESVVGDVDIKSCRGLCEGFLRNDASVCASFKNFEGQRNCQAYLQLNDKIEGISIIVKDKIFHLKAIKNKDSNFCNRISNENKRINCQAYLRGDLRTCEQNKDFKKFRQLYCSKIAKENKQ